MSAKRLLVLTNRVPYPLNDGGNLAMSAMIKGYVKLGWEVYLLSMNTTRHYVANDVLSEIYKDLYQFETVDIDNSVGALQVISNFFFSRQPNHADRFYQESFREKLKEVLVSFNPSVIQLESIFLATYLRDIREASKAFTTLRLHNIEYQIWERLAHETKNPIKKYYLSNLAGRIKHFEEDVWGKFDLLLPITNIDAEIVANTVSQNIIHVAPYGLETVMHEQEARQEKWVGYHIGAMDWQPNVEGVKWFIEDAWPIVTQSSPEFEFHFAGRNMPQSLFDMHIEGVSCEGMVPDANDFIADKKILIVPIHSGGGIRVKILEAMAMGKIVISTSIGMQGIDAQHSIHFLLADDATGFANAISWCLNNRDKAVAIGAKAKSLISKNYMAESIMSAINEKIIARIS